MRHLVLASLLFGALAVPTAGAPIPRAPRLTEEHLLGHWNMQWGDRTGDSIAFYADGTAWQVYLAQDFVCRWWIDARGKLVLIERLLRANGAACDRSTRYEFDVDPSRYPTITATGVVRVVLTRAAG